MGQVSIAHNAIGSPTLVNLICTGNTVPVATVALSPALDFGDQIVNIVSAPRSVNIANTGTAPLTVSGIVQSEPEFRDNPDYVSRLKVRNAEGAMVDRLPAQPRATDGRPVRRDVAQFTCGGKGQR